MFFKLGVSVGGVSPEEWANGLSLGVTAILVGSSAAAAAFAAREVLSREEKGGPIGSGNGSSTRTAVVVFPDGPERYMSKKILGTFEEWKP